MTEYIEREAARQAHIKASLTTRLIDAIPSADVAPVRHGKWNDINPTVLNHRLIDITDFFDSLTNCETVSGVLTKLSKQPTIDPVVAAGGCYCRECRWGQIDDISTMHCHKYHTHKQPDGFCSDGQRKEAAHG